MANLEYRALLQCASGLTDLLQHNLSVSSKLLEKGLITKDVHDFVLTAQGVSNQVKAARLVSCLTDRVKDAAQVFHDFVDLLKEDPFFVDIVEKLNTEHKTLIELEKPCDGGKDEKDEKVGEHINMLEKQFSSMQRKLLSELTTNSEISPETLVDSLTLLPVALRTEYHKFVFDNLDTLESAASIRKIFRHINLHFTFIDHGLMGHLIGEFGSEQLRRDMSAYSVKMKSFLSQTTVLQLMDHWPGRRDIPPHFEELMAVIDGDPSTYTLQQLDDLRRRLCSETRLSETIFVLIGVGKKNSFVVRWVFPSIFVPRLKSVISSLRSFYQREHIFSVTVGRQRLYSIAAQYEERLLLLCKEVTGDITEFEYLLSQPGLDINIFDEDGRTPLWHMSYDGRTELVQLFLEHGAEVDLPTDDEWGDTALMAACDEGHVTIAALLISKGAVVDLQNKYGHHPLYTASFDGRLELVKLLLDHGAQIDLPTNDHLGFTALGAACQEGHLDVSRLLIERGASIDHQNKEGTSALYKASEEGHDDVVQLLLASSASVDLPTKDEDCFTALCCACGYGHVKVVMILVDNGADVNYQAKEEWTLLIFASSGGHTHVVELLIEHGAKLDIKNNEGRTALSLACYEGHSDTTRILVQRGANTDVQDQEGLTALMLATQSGHTDCIKILLDGNADPNLPDQTTGWSAIFFAAKQGNTEITELLIRGGAELDIKDKNGLTVFEVAKAHDQQAVCDLLEKHGSKATGKEITQEQQEQAKTSSQRLVKIFDFFERTLLRGRAKKREQKQSNKDRTSSNILETRHEKRLAKKMKGMTIHPDTKVVL